MIWDGQAGPAFAATGPSSLRTAFLPLLPASATVAVASSRWTSSPSAQSAAMASCRCERSIQPSRTGERARRWSKGSRASVAVAFTSRFQSQERQGQARVFIRLAALLSFPAYPWDCDPLQSDGLAKFPIRPFIEGLLANQSHKLLPSSILSLRICGRRFRRQSPRTVSLGIVSAVVFWRAGWARHRCIAHGF